MTVVADRRDLLEFGGQTPRNVFVEENGQVGAFRLDLTRVNPAAHVPADRTNERAGAPAGMGKGRAFAPPPGNVEKCFLCISSYSKTFSRPIIYALFSQLVVSFWGLCPQTPTAAPPLDPAGGLSSPDPLICPPLEKILRAPMRRLNH